VLSMGAVFAIFAGFYYWVGKITGYNYNEFLGIIHFWITFIGVNITFFPMHFLGIAGMPRRIPEYLDIYFELNKLCSYGALISGYSIFFWYYIVWRIFTDKIPCPVNPWNFNNNPKISYEELTIICDRLVDIRFRQYAAIKGLSAAFLFAYKSKKVNTFHSSKISYKINSLEWSLSSPPKLHSFIVPPFIIFLKKNIDGYLVFNNKAINSINSIHSNNNLFQMVNIKTRYSTLKLSTKKCCWIL
jgi:heme/copper-type cytochrome/quinol oxidase subunit 1